MDFCHLVQGQKFKMFGFSYENVIWFNGFTDVRDVDDDVMLFKAQWFS